MLRATPLSNTLDSLLALDPLKGASWSVLFVDVEAKQELLNHDADRLLIPASVTKLWTTSAALDALGADEKFETVVSSKSGVDSQGTLPSDLIVSCSGDAIFEQKNRRDLGAPALDKLADQLQSLGLKRIAGSIVIHTGNYRRSCGNGVWEMGDLREGFAPSVDAAGYNSNVCHVKIESGPSVGDPAVLTIEPSFANIAICNTIVTTPGGQDSWVEFNVTPCRDELELSGSFSKGDRPQYLWFPIQNPAAYFGNALRDALSRKGIDCAGHVEVKRQTCADPGQVLVRWTSPPLAEIVSTINKDSDNYLAEYLLAALGSRKRAEGSAEAGLQVVTSFARASGIPREQLTLQDGCGLSRQNLVSAKALVTLLIKMTTTVNAAAFESSLSQSGLDGTLNGRLSDEGLQGRVRAKTGTMTHVSALAGYIGLDNGHKLAFAIMCNNFRCSRHYVRTVQDNIIRAVYHAAN
ncbi:MAG: D-alanyl-D-alanine carboxypeptidase/D-alanyl-D-alanine-endopeptidase [Calditrichaeota bacterium]|nr:D-alanyl-D-alanine carboxypeptidase/D-alanyl-D-alanine-endopeptidase [Calditrichota bacterium]MCB9391927.1 D-alanyl-D-alanine carboxypeptidase/D-alanyl-D-alanine-endopeptidase [Calditrichota bacterium]